MVPRAQTCCETLKRSPAIAAAADALTTTGYGNLVPSGNPGQTFAVLEMVIGQLLLVVAVAKVVSAWRPGQGREGLRKDSGDD